MSTDSLDEETKRILAEADSDDSSESTVPKKVKKTGKTWTETTEDGITYETNDKDTPDEEW